MSRWPRGNPRVLGTVLCVAGAVLLAVPDSAPIARRLPGDWPVRSLSLALGLELIGLAFWCWARAAVDAARQVRRWIWLRRPAQAMWLAAAAEWLTPWAAPQSAAADGLPRLAAAAVVWAGLELMAALPLARPFSDLAGPLLVVRPWLPALLPAAGFAVLWHAAPQWTAIADVRRIAEALLIVTAVLATLRAYGRRQWATALRWLAVSESALAAALVATQAFNPTVTLLLWLGSFGGRSFMLAGERRGATPRRGTLLSRLWRAAGWTGSGVLTWALLVALLARLPGAVLTLPPAGATLEVIVTTLEILAVTGAGMLTAYVSVRRLIRAAERRSFLRPDPVLTLSHFTALLTLGLGPAAIVIAFVSGTSLPWPAFVPAALPPLVGGALAVLGARGRVPLVAGFETMGGRARRTARLAFRAVTAFERRIVDTLGGALRAAVAPMRDLHTGDAQEYLLFLVGLSVLALVLPFLR